MEYLDEEKLNIQKLQDPDQWVHIFVPRNVKKTNIEMACAVCDSVESITPKDIIGTQYVMDTSLWGITLSSYKQEQN